MKFLERLALVIYSYVMILMSIVLGLLIFNWIELDKVAQMVRVLITGSISSKVLLGLSVFFILLSIHRAVLNGRLSR